MSEDIKQDVVQRTQKSLGKYVKKPPLTDKLLKKPPFRFLQDIVKAVIKDTGFLKGLYSEEELNADNAKDRDAKVMFLNKLIEAVKAISKVDLKVKPNKIVAGLEPTETNLLLQAIAKALDKKLDSSDYVNRLKSGEIVAAPEKKKTKKPIDKESKKSQEKDEKPIKKEKQHDKKRAPSIETPKSTDRSNKSKTSKNLPAKESNSKIKLDETKTKARTDNTKKDAKPLDPDKESTKEGIAQDSSKNKAPDDENVSPLTPKLDSISDVSRINELNHRKSNEEKPQSKSPNDPEDFPSLSVRNKADETLESVSAMPPEDDGSSRTKRSSSSAARPKSARPKSGDLTDKNHHRMQARTDDPERTQNSTDTTPVDPVHMTTNNHLSNNSSSKITSRPRSSLRPPSVRPSSARPGAPRLRPDSAIPGQEMVPMGKINVIVENFDKNDPSSAVSSAAIDEEETVVIQSNLEDSLVDSPNGDIISGLEDVPKENKGQLVEQILEQINEDEEERDRGGTKGGSSTGKTEIDWQDEGMHRDSLNKETSGLRSLIQTLTKTANPLGKLLSYVHEDIEAMQAELESWTKTKKQLLSEISKEKKKSAELNKPLLSQLDNLNVETRKLEDEIANIRGTILRNNARINQLVTKK